MSDEMNDPIDDALTAVMRDMAEAAPPAPEVEDLIPTFPGIRRDPMVGGRWIWIATAAALVAVIAGVSVLLVGDDDAPGPVADEPTPVAPATATPEPTVTPEPTATPLPPVADVVFCDVEPELLGLGDPFGVSAAEAPQYRAFVEGWLLSAPDELEAEAELNARGLLGHVDRLSPYNGDAPNAVVQQVIDNFQGPLFDDAVEAIQSWIDENCPTA